MKRVIFDILSVLSGADDPLNAPSIIRLISNHLKNEFDYSNLFVEYLHYCIKENLIKGYGSTGILEYKFLITDYGKKWLNDNKFVVEIMLDTCVFDNILDGKILFDDINDSNRIFYITPSQIVELSKCPDVNRRISLLLCMQRIRPELLSHQSAVWDVTFWNSCYWTEEGNLYQKIKDYLDKHSLRNGEPKPSNIHDALIGEVCLQKNMVCFTSDKHLKYIVEELGGTVMFYEKGESRGTLTCNKPID